MGFFFLFDYKIFNVYDIYVNTDQPANKFHDASQTSFFLFKSTKISHK